jgi:hypothetical protein
LGLRLPELANPIVQVLTMYQQLPCSRMSLGLRLVAQQATYLLMLVNEGQASYPARWFDLFTATAAGFQPTATDAAVVEPV